MTAARVEFRVGNAVDVPVGEGRAVTVGDEMVAVFRLRTGQFRAVSAVCPHAGGPIADGLIDASVVICPLHQHVFDLATGVCRTGQPALRVYGVRVEDDGGLIVTVPVAGPDHSCDPPGDPVHATDPTRSA